MIEKLNAIKRSKATILRSVGLLTGLWDLTDIVDSRQNCSKNKLVSGKRRGMSKWKLLVPGYGLLAAYRLKAKEANVKPLITAHSFTSQC